MSRVAEHVYTPSELNHELKLHLEAGFPRLVLEGEISNLGRPASGHLYFSLKDERAQIRCAMFRSAAMRARVQPENGMKVTARGRISLYEPRGEYQLIVESLQEAGEGLLQQQFEALKKKLEAEGLFDAALKKPLPRFPRRIALVTSPSGAAVRDLLHVLDRRWPLARVRLYPVRVQGIEAPGEIQAAIVQANRHRWAEVLITGRGGGSLEDLIAFNDEGVARAVAGSAIPIVSAVGHETDFSICDFVADLRAPTPSAAAELTTPDAIDLLETFRRLDRQLQRRQEAQLQQAAQKLDHATHRLLQRHPSARLAEQARELSGLENRLARAMRQALQNRGQRLQLADRRRLANRPERKLAEFRGRLEIMEKSLHRQVGLHLVNARERLANLSRTLNAVSPLQTLGRGYAVLTDESGTVVSSTGQVAPGDPVTAQVSDGSIDMTVRDRRKQ